MIEKQMKELAWNTFKQTGNINTFMEFRQIENIEESKKGTIYGNHQNKGNYPFGK